MRRKITSLMVAMALMSFVKAQAPVVTVQNGVFVGISAAVANSTSKVNKFLGIPFAVTPPQRYSPAEPAPASNMTRTAMKYGPGCINQGNATILPGTLNDTKGMPDDSEDCLYVNVYTPSNASSRSLPVMFWVYGGSFSSGRASIPTYDGSNIAVFQDVIVVSANYRLNIFGYPGPTPGLPEQHNNLGMLDIRLALDWTKRNIAAFGGDPDKITLFGESAGAINVDYLYLTTPPTDPPFRAVILQSGTYYLGAFGTGVLYNQSNSTSTSGQAITRSLGCNWDDSTISCMRNKTTKEIKKALDDIPRLWGPTPDGGVNVPANWNGQKYRTLFGGAQVPTLLGTNADEGMLFLTEKAPSNFSFMFSSRFPELKPYEQQVRAAYPIGGCSLTGCWRDEQSAVSAVITDYMFTCLASREARASVLAGTPTWRYRYNITSGGVEKPFNYSVPHAFEIPQIFGTYNPAVATPDQVAVSKFMQKAWADFAKDPYTGPGWTAYSNSSYISKVAGIGGPQNRIGEAILSLNDVDAYCGIYDGLYDLKDPPN